MEAWLLREWQRTSLWQILLRPLSWLFALLAGARRSLYRSGILKGERAAVPVIVVGNITVGGTGKTPVVLAILRHLEQSGRRCGIISRGYSRSNMAKQMRPPPGTVIHVVPPSEVSPVFSDEAQLLASRSGAPVYISADRVAAARSLLRNHPQIDVLISDDGLQHYALHRDIEICVVDGERAFGNGALLPAGPLREPISRVESVDAIVINGPPAQGQLTFPHTVPAFSMSLGNELLIRVRDDKAISIEQGLAQFSGKRVHAIAGTGNPSRFFAHLDRLGFIVANTRSFPDHHPFIKDDFTRTDAEVVLMTEKDAVKCKAFADDRIWFMRVDAILPEAFGELIVKRLSELKK